MSLQQVAQVAICTIAACALIAYLSIQFAHDKRDFAQGLLGLVVFGLWVFLCVAAAGWVVR